MSGDDQHSWSDECRAAKLAAMHRVEAAFTPDDLAEIAHRTLVMVADDDEVRPEHATAMYRSLPNSELAVVPGTSRDSSSRSPTCATS
jgi:pimeloyl-ACP methyl ester carboxylesterase